MKVCDFRKYAVGVVYIYSNAMSLLYFGDISFIPSEFLDCRICLVYQRLLSSFSEDYGDEVSISIPCFVIRLES